jgi:hypothetical protein
MTEWQRIAEIPIDTARLVLVDPRNLEDVFNHEADGDMSYELVANERGIAVALLVGTGLGDGSYPVWARFEEAAGAVRVAEVKITFLPHPVLGRELPR